MTVTNAPPHRADSTPRPHAKRPNHLRPGIPVSDLRIADVRWVPQHAVYADGASLLWVREHALAYRSENMCPGPAAELYVTGHGGVNIRWPAGEPIRDGQRRPGDTPVVDLAEFEDDPW
jgi:hypothetical protein